MTEQEIEIERLALEKAQFDLAAKKLALEADIAKKANQLEERRLVLESSKPWYSTSLPWLGPTLGALVAVFTLVGNQNATRTAQTNTASLELESRATAARLERDSRNSAAALERESRRYDRESKVILQATDGVTPAQAVKNLAFYLEAGLISDPDNLIAPLVDAAKAPVTNPTTDSLSECTVSLEPTSNNSNLSISDHRMSGITFCSSPNTSGPLTDNAPKFIVVNFSGTPTLEYSLRVFQSMRFQSSSHLVIGRQGQTVQMVPFDQIAWHSGKSSFGQYIGMNKYSLGVTLVNLGPLTKKPTGQWMSHGGRQFGARVPDDQVDVINGKGWHKYSDSQIETLARTLKPILKQYGLSAENVIGQSDVRDQATGPGPNFPWDDLRTRLTD